MGGKRLPPRIRPLPHKLMHDLEELGIKECVDRRNKYKPEEVAEQLLEWVQEEDSVTITAFCADYGYHMQYVDRWRTISPEFSYAFDIARMKIAERRERLHNTDLVKVAPYTRYQSLYDPFLQKHEREEKEFESKTKRSELKEVNEANLVLLAKLASEGKITQLDK